MRRRIVLLTCLVTLVLWLGFGSAGYSQTPEPTPPAAEETPPDDASVPASAPAAPPSAEEVMQQLMQRRREAPPLIEPTREPRPGPVVPDLPANPPSIPLSPPALDATVVGPAPGEPQPTLLREGQFIVQRKARIVVTPDGTHIAVFDQDATDDSEETQGIDQPALAPMILLRSRRLESIEEVLTRHGEDALFRLTGPVYVYHGANYLLPMQAAPTGRQVQRPEVDATGETPVTEADRITQELLEQLQERSLSLPSADADAAATPTTATDPRVAGTAPGTADDVELMRDGEVLLNRRGRLIRTPEGYQLFVFEADDRQSPESPMLLQPSGLLQNMERIVTDRGDTVVFIVSGQVQVYRGANYLLPTMMRVAVPKGNLKISS